MTTSELTQTAWRLILTEPSSGAWNMAVDEVLLKSVGVGDSLPVLRLYAWSPPCLSLGYAQPISDIDQELLHQNGWDLVRRLTGGRAILHADELTYSVIAPNDEPRLSGDILTSYLRLSTALVAAIRELGAPATVAPHTDRLVHQGNNQDPVCFQVPSSYEILIDGKKILGSAQARKKEGILQHGTLPLYGDLSRILQVVKGQNNPSHSRLATQGKWYLSERAATMEEALGTPPTWEEAAQAFVNAFSRTLNISFIEDKLSSEEKRNAKELINEKYANPGWNERI